MQTFSLIDRVLYKQINTNIDLIQDVLHVELLKLDRLRQQAHDYYIKYEMQNKMDFSHFISCRPYTSEVHDQYRIVDLLIKCLIIQQTKNTSC